MALTPTGGMLWLTDASVESKRIVKGKSFWSDRGHIKTRGDTTVFHKVHESDTGIQHIVWNATGACGTGADESEATYYFLSNLYFDLSHILTLLGALQKP